MNDVELRDLLPDLPVLVEFARTGSVTGAADELRLPQPSASRALARLAARSGVALTQREGRGLTLPPAGRQLADAAAEALAIVVDGVIAARRSEAAQNALVRVAYQAVLGESYLPRAITRFRARHPSVRFHLVHGSRARCIEAVRAHEVDISIVADPPQLDALRTAPFFREPIVLVVARTHALAALGRAVRPQEIPASELIMLAPGFGMHDSVRALLSLPAEADFTFEVDDSRLARGLVATGAGVTILPMSRSDPGENVVEVPIDDPRAERRVGALLPHTPGDVVEDFLATLSSIADYRWAAAGLTRSRAR